MIDVSCFASVERCINNELLVKREEVAVTDSNLIVVDFSAISFRDCNLFSYVFDHDVLWIQSAAKGKI